jgi:crotonobetainyl-CoA:carnitine CoA-transferase CaiB-like acyl-CoA transferase
MDNVQVVANELIETFDQPGLGAVRQPRPAARFDQTPARIGGPAPRIGEHTRAVLTELGYDPAEIEALMTSRDTT